MIELKGYKVIVTGATRGIGRQIALSLADAGADVAFTYASSDDAAISLEKEIKQKNREVIYKKFDVSDFKECEIFVSEVLAKWQKIDGLVNNAGITKDTLMLRMNPQQWDDVIRVNLSSVFNMTKSCLKTFLKQQSGSIVNMSSVVGVKGNSGQANYAASKAGIIGFTKSIALECGSRNIRSNAIAPGFIKTEMTDKLNPSVIEEWEKGIPLKRAGQPSDIANTTLFLLSPYSNYISGQVINVCGGMLT